MNANETNDNRNNIPENDPSNAMNTKRDVATSPDEKTDEDFPGYPHYPASEDIMSQSTGAHRVDASLEEMGTGPNASGVNQRFLAGGDSDRMQTGNSSNSDAEGEEAGLDGTSEERGVPQNVANEELGGDLPGTDVDEAADKGSLNP